MSEASLSDGEDRDTERGSLSEDPDSDLDTDSTTSESTASSRSDILEDDDEDAPRDGVGEAPHVHLKKNTSNRNPHELTFGTANLRLHLNTDAERMTFAEQMIERGLDAVALQEVYALPNTQREIRGILFWTGPALSKPRDNSMAVMCCGWAIRTGRFNRVVTDMKASSKRLLIIQVTFKGVRYNLANAYRPYLASKNKTNIDAVDAALEGLKKRRLERLIVLGDFNVQPDLCMAQQLGTVQQAFVPFLSSAIAKDVRLLDIAKGLVLMNFFSTPGKEKWGVPHGVTWLGPVPQDPNHRPQERCYDLILATADIVKNTSRVFRSSKMVDSTDHFPMMIKVKAVYVAADVSRVKRKSEDERIELLKANYKKEHKETFRHPGHRVAYIRRLQDAVRKKEAETPHSDRTMEQIRETREERRVIRREISRLDRWVTCKKLYSAARAAATGNLEKTFSLVNDILGTKQRSSQLSHADLMAQAVTAMKSLQQRATNTFQAPKMERQPDECWTPAESWITGFTDGSKYRKRRRDVAGAGVWIPQLDLRLRARVPDDLRQTSGAGEVLGALLLLRRCRTLPANIGIEVITDSEYVEYFLNNKLELLLVSDFSDVSHPDLWREIVRELVLFPREIRAKWVRSHTGASDEHSINNAIVDGVAKEAAQGINITDEISIDTSPVMAPIRAGKPGLGECRLAVRDLVTEACGGPDGMVAAACVGEGEKIMHAIIGEIWDTEKVSKHMQDGIMQLIAKKDPKADPRPLTIVNVILKVLENIIRRRLGVIPLLPTQYGFQRARDTTMAIRMVRRRMRKASRNGRKLHIVFCDFSNAYNSVERGALWETLRQHNTPENVINILMSSYEATTKVEGTDLSFEATSGVGQGRPLSPLLFNLALDAAVRCSSLSGDLCSVVFYADDAILMHEEPDELQAHLLSFQEQAHRLGLKFNLAEGKTEAMIVLPEMHSKRYQAHRDKAGTSMGIYGYPLDPKKNVRTDPLHLSATADTRNGRDYIVLCDASHLWCPICAYIQNSHKAPIDAFKLLKRHFTSEHPTCTLSRMEPNIVPLTTFGVVVPLAPFLARQPIEPATGLFFVVRDILDPGVAPDLPVSWTTKYKYLGQKIELLGGNAAAILDRIDVARRTFYGPLGKLWENPNASRPLKCFIYNVIVMSKLKYGLNAIVPSPSELEALRKFHHDTLKIATGISHLVTPWGDRVDVQYHESLVWANARDIAEVLRTERLLLAGRIARANRDHPIHGDSPDEWDAQIDRDLAALPRHHGKPRTREDLADKYSCSTMLKSSEDNLRSLRALYLIDR